MNNLVNEEKQVETVSPLYSWTNRFRELFKQDPEVKMSFDQNTKTIHMIVSNPIKALCIRHIFPASVNIGEGTVNIEVAQANRFGGDKYMPEVILGAFENNPIFDYMYWWADPEATTSPHCWVVMDKEPIFFPESDLHNIYGDAVELPENLANDVLTPFTDYIHYCTGNPDREAPDHNVAYF